MKQIPDKAIFLLGALALLLYGFVGLWGRFQIYDDHRFVLDNPYVTTARPMSAYFTDAKSLSSTGHGIYRPLRTLSYRWDYIWWRTNPFGYHLTSVLLHALNGILVYVVAKQLCGDRRMACLVGVVFLVHPVQVEAVTWVAGRGDVLYASFFLLAVLLFQQFEKTARYGCLAGSFACFLGAMLCKETGLVLPVVLCCLPLQPSMPVRRPRILACFAVTALLVVLARAHVLGHFHVQVVPEAGLMDRLTTVPYLLIRYVILSVCPCRLRAMYDIQPVRFLSASFWLYLTLLGLYLFIVLKMRKTYRGLSFGIALFFAPLVPVLNIVPNNGWFFEHFLYLSIAGFGLSWVVFCKGLCMPKKYLRIVCFLYVMVLAVSCVQRQFVWRDGQSVWEDAVSKSPDMEVPRMLLARTYVAEGDFPAASRCLARGLTMHPDSALLWREMGILHRRSGRFQQALACLKQSHALDSANASIHWQLFQVYWDVGDMIAAQAELSWLRHNGMEILDNCAHYASIGAFHLAAGDFARAEDWLRKAIDYRAQQTDALLNLALLRIKQKQFTEAVDVLGEIADLSEYRSMLLDPTSVWRALHERKDFQTLLQAPNPD